MQINTNTPLQTQQTQQSAIKTLYTEKISKDEVKAIREELEQNVAKFMFDVTKFQADALGQSVEDVAYNDFQNFLKEIGYDGTKSISDLSQEEAAALVSEDGIFGVKQTSQRIADFVIQGANGDEDKLRAGREGMLLGFKQAEEMWGGKLPEISQETMKSALEMVDKEFATQGYSILNTQA